MTPMELRKNILLELASLMDNEEAMRQVYDFLAALKGEGMAEPVPGLPYTKEERRQSLSQAEAEVMSGRVSPHGDVVERINQQIAAWK